MKAPMDAEREEVANRLYLLRLALGHESQVSMVKFLDKPFTVQLWNNWERGRNLPDLAQARAISRKTGATVDWIYWAERAGLPLHLAQRLEEVGRQISRA